jgi:hypothetical protein
MASSKTTNVPTVVTASLVGYIVSDPDVIESMNLPRRYRDTLYLILHEQIFDKINSGPYFVFAKIVGIYKNLCECNVCVCGCKP